MDIISVLSHEIRNPLTTIRAYAEVLMRPDYRLTDEERKEYASAIKRAADKANGALSNVIEITLSDSGLLSLVTESISLQELILKTVEDMRSEARERTLEVSIPRSLPRIEADGAKIERVLRNLLSNAIKFTPEHGVIRISARQSTRSSDAALANVPRPGVVVSIADNGAGIPAREQSRIFTKFYRSSHAGNNTSGLGIGLYVCKQIVKAHNGIIWVKSQPQQGSEFSFYLPCSQTNRTQ